MELLKWNWNKTNPEDPHYCLSEEQERTIYRVRKILEFTANLADMAQPDKTPTICHEGLSCLLCALEEMLPKADDMAFLIGSEMEKRFSHRANDDAEQGGNRDE